MSFGTILYTLLIRPLQMFFEFLFLFAQRFTNDPGVSIIILSIVMNFLVLPLYKRADAMQAEERDTEAKLHDGLAHIKKSFTGDERMMMTNTYYRQNHYKPTDAFKGSISLFLEIPFFIAAYQFLSHLELLQGVSFGPIVDLGAQDGLLVIGGFAINVLPILMTTVNLISCVIYTKGYPLKTKIQLYAMAIFFFFFLYNSPAGLVFYWTLNNIFSLIKTIFYKLKHPGLIVAIMASIAGICLAVYGGIFSSNTIENNAILVAIGVALQLPILLNVYRTKRKNQGKEKNYVPNKKIFLAAALFLALIMGVLIPSAVITSSPQEFVDLNYYHHPFWYILSSFCLAVGTFVIWFGVFYSLSKPKGKVAFEKVMWSLCGIAMMDYMFFGTKMGILTNTLSYNDSISFSKVEIAANIGLILVLCIVFTTTYKRFKKFTMGALATGILAIAGMSGVNMYHINAETATLKATSAATQQASPHFTLSRTANNVVFIMLDRAIGPYVPYIMNEKPELKTQFDGFTYYSSTVSYGWHTNFASPALFGGYEYSAVNINKRSDESLVSKQNEALKVMPVLFEQNGYDVTVCDPSYANYKWIPDLSIYDDYPNIHTYLVNGKFNNTVSKGAVFEANCRNFFCYSIMKSSPLVVQRFLYDSGKYGQINESDSYGTQSTYGTSKAEGISSTFMDAYNVLKNLSNMTTITDTNQGGFLFLTNDTSHETTLLQEPEYEPAAKVDNTAYDTANASRFTVNGVTMTMETAEQYATYQSDMAAFIQLGKYFDYLREQGLYDNTKIIIAADHGFPYGQFDSLKLTKSDGTIEDMQAYAPLLLVKDFNATGFTTNDEPVSNASVPTLAFKDVISNPVNPFTGNAITDADKVNRQYVIDSDIYETWVNNGNTFLPSDWYSVQGSIWDINNWKQEATNSVNP